MTVDTDGTIKNEYITMTPSSEEDGSPIIKIERVMEQYLDTNCIHYKGGGPYEGVYINNKSISILSGNTQKGSALQIEFKCSLFDEKSEQHKPEKRTLYFWFRSGTDYRKQVKLAYELFKQLVSLDDLPKKYYDFIKKAIVLMKNNIYNSISKLVLRFKTCDSQQENLEEQVDTRPPQVRAYEEILNLFEMVYPNNINLTDIKNGTNLNENVIVLMVAKLIKEKLIIEISDGHWMRYTEDEESKVENYNRIKIGEENKPTVAIITSKYCEKLAVDAIMLDKVTFAKYKTEGESNVYTLGSIGSVRVVATKLPMVGKMRNAQIASANTTTRLLGIFDSVDYIILMGVCGGVPHYADYYQHVRKGDVVISCSNEYLNLNDKIVDSVEKIQYKRMSDIYVMCDQAEKGESFDFNQDNAIKSWKSPSEYLIKCSNEIIKDTAFEIEWNSNIDNTLKILHSTQTAQNFSQPLAKTDVLQMEMDGSYVQVAHPRKPTEIALNESESVGSNDEENGTNEKYGKIGPKVHMGVIGSARAIMTDYNKLGEFIAEFNCRALDYEFDQVIESIVGNRKENFILVRGISEYEYKTSITNEWEPNASLNAAAFTKMLIEKL